MIVHKNDGACRACGGTLVIVDAGDATMTVECQEEPCGNCYLVEPDAFGNGYYVGVLAHQMQGREDA